MKKTQDGHRKHREFLKKNKENEAPPLAPVQRHTIFGTVQEQPNGDIVLPAGMLETIEKSFDKLPESTYKFIKNFVCEFSTVGILLFNLNKVLYKIKFLFLGVQICYTCVPKTTVNIYVPFHTHILPCTLLIYIQDVT